ncbi:hypothetical protein AY600_07010 [Phormidium willei BDU 130791]|nr:hypothetical protein AY600_07010 [Phormidium willei BDU 130791]
MDSFTDGHQAGGIVGSNSVFEFYGMAMMEKDGQIYIGMNSNLGLDGADSSWADDDDVISYGDLFFNFTGDGLDDAAGNLFAIHFANRTNSGVSEAGVYRDVTGTNVAKQNSGFQHLNHHANKVNGLHVNRNGGEGANMADLASNDAYWQSGINQNYKAVTSIASGERVGGINMLESTTLASLGLDFASYGGVGSETFGFSFDKSLLPDGDFIAHIFAECVNDGMAMVGNLASADVDPESVPEPASILGLLAVGGVMLNRKRERHA